MQLTEKLYYYPWAGRANNCNSYLLKGEQVILFDPGHIQNELGEKCLDTLEAGLAIDGVSLGDIDVILLTHGHPDHSEAAGLVRQKSGALLGVHPGDLFILEGIEHFYEERTGQKPASLKPDFELSEGLLTAAGTLSLGEQIEVLSTPGHSPGSVCFYLPAEKALLSGDTIFQSSIGRTDFPGGDFEMMRQSVEKLAAFAGAELYLPGHMGLIKGEAAIQRNFEQIRLYFF